ncbi:MAG: hypothetical protein N3D11_13985 [Candidatus Sumerlaeia bacterium]|nr:hypothetical protein [Candidatus Sumerlaeia bacterium]
MIHRIALAVVFALTAQIAAAGVGDPQLMTDHPWYPGELSCSTFDRLFRTQAALYERVTGRKVVSDEDKALASWYWRNLNYFHCTGGNEDIWDKGLKAGEETREYWSGLFGFGYGLCYADHHQWHGEMARLLGPFRARSAGVAGHTTFEVWLTGGPYGEGRWALLDHDISTVVFTPDGRRLMGLMEVNQDLSAVKKSDKRRGFIPAGLHPSDPDTYKEIKWVGYTTGYAGPPPMVHLRSGESLRRYLKPGLDDGKTFAYWGINYNIENIPGPTRDRTWVNQPEAMYGSGRQAPYKAGQARYANAVYIYKPDFRSEKYKEGVIAESDKEITFEFYSPYIIAASPPPASARAEWGIYEPGCTGGLILAGTMTCPVEVSVDQGRTWQKAGAARNGLDLTDYVKGRRQYWLRFHAGAKELAGSGLTIKTVCQCAPTIIPRPKSGLNRITYEASGLAVISAGPNIGQAVPHIVAGAFDSPGVTLKIALPRGSKAVRVYAAARAASGAPPVQCAYNIECSTDGGTSWQPVVKDWQIIRRQPEPNDWWSQTFIMGDAPVNTTGPIHVRFSNTGGRKFLRAEAHLVYEVGCASPLTAKFVWKSGGEIKSATHVYSTAPAQSDNSWSFDAGTNPDLLWVEYSAD